MMGIGAAIGGFAQGAAQGLKLRSELDDAEERRGLMKLQKEAAQLDLQKRRDEKAYEDEKKALITNLLSPKEEPTVTAPPADQESLPEYERGQPGIQVPGRQNLFSAASGGSINDLATLTKINNALIMLDAKHSKLTSKDLLDGAKRYKDLQSEGVMDAWQKVAAGDYEGAINTFNSTGKFKLPEGTRFEAKQEDDGFGAGRKITNYYAIAPDGRTVNYRDMMRGTIAPEKLMEIDSATGYRIADLGLKRTAEENAATRHTEIFKLTELKYNKIIDEQKAQTSIALERLNLAKDDARYQKTQQAFTGAFAELANTVGVDKKFDYNLAGNEQKADQAGKLQAVSLASAIFEMNYDLSKNAAGLTPQVAYNVLKQARANPGSVKFDEEKGMHYVENGKSRAYVPSLLAPKEASNPPPGTSPTAAQPSRQASGAIRTPDQSPAQRAYERGRGPADAAEDSRVTEAQKRAASDPDIVALQEKINASRMGDPRVRNGLIQQMQDLKRERYGI